MSRKWQFWIDRGGTFTDIVARQPDGRTVTHKLLSENPEQYEDAALQGIRTLLGLSGSAKLPADQIASVKMGTTVATNALLERKGEPTLLVITRGFGEALHIGYQNRPHLFDLDIPPPDLLYQQVIEANERVTSTGEILTPFTPEDLRPALEAAYNAGLRAVAIVFLHGDRYPDHEQAAAQLARDIGFTQISTSHETSPLIKLISRGDTTVVDAYLSPILRRYVDRVQAHLGDIPLYFMQSSGGLTNAGHFQGKDAILSGPAGGIVGLAKTSTEAGFDKCIGFDMGGTSTDVAHYRGQYERSFETQVAGVRMRVPMMDIHTVAAGGGSILQFDGQRFRVGPHSAGATPGPAAYRRGGPLTLTDCNLFLGRLSKDDFPAVFGPHANQPLDTDIVQQKFTELHNTVNAAGFRLSSPEDIAEGFLTIGIENMAAAIKKISIQRGYDVSQYTLVCFGGAGGQHACRVADRLGMSRVFIHPYAGVLSAFGMGLADLRALREQGINLLLSEADFPAVKDHLQRLCQNVCDELAAQNVSSPDVSYQLHIRYHGSDSPLQINFDPGQHGVPELTRLFETEHLKQFGFIDADTPLIIEAATVEAAGGGEKGNIYQHIPPTSSPEDDQKTARFYAGGQWVAGPRRHRHTILPGQVIHGPALIIEDHGTNLLEPGWQAETDTRGNLILTRVSPAPRQQAVGTDADPVMLEIFNNLFMNIAEQMGIVLEKVAHSVNMKERLDFSCAVFDAQGNLIANAPHVPVHLGSMGASVRSIIQQNQGQMQRGDVYLLNDPYRGGTHLPDITVITPYFIDSAPSQSPDFYVATRGHHADIGGITPGSMPPFSRHIDEEGILFSNFKLVDKGQFRETALRQHLASGPYPARNIDQNIADLKAQIAANKKGLQELVHMVAEFGVDTVRAYMGHVQDNAAQSVRQVITQLRDGRCHYKLDNGAEIHIAVSVNTTDKCVTLDFTGTSPQLADLNFNAPRAITEAAILYVFRCLVQDDIPLNEGCLSPVKIILPKGCFLHPSAPAAVVAGNVETSQCIVNALFRALGIQASSQGTMNNVTFGNDAYQYYETLAGGMGATATADGASARQVHMTNSRLTDPEVLENRYPVRVEEFAIRHNSGGRGQQHRGGDGVARTLRFTESMTVALISNHRQTGPAGLNGGQDGKPGANQLIRASGDREELDGCTQVDVLPGDRLVIETPGGGGYGPLETL